MGLKLGNGTFLRLCYHGAFKPSHRFGNDNEYLLDLSLLFSVIERQRFSSFFQLTPLLVAHGETGYGERGEFALLHPVERLGIIFSHYLPTEYDKIQIYHP